MLIHCTYHHNYLELYKISMPDLYRLRPPPTSRSPSPPSTSSSSFAAVFPAEHTELLQALQADCYFHAREIARLLAEAAEHGIRLLSDSVLPFLILDSSRVLLYYVARLLDPDRMDASERFQEAVEAVEGNKKLLRMMAPLFPVSETFVSLFFPNPILCSTHGCSLIVMLVCNGGAVAAQGQGKIAEFCAFRCQTIGRSGLCRGR